MIKLFKCFKIYLFLAILYENICNSIEQNIQDPAFVPFNHGKTFPLDRVLGENFWSTLVPGHYFGLRAAQPNSSLISMMWFTEEGTTQKNLNLSPSVRHLCRQEDPIRYSWDYHDFHDFGHQSIQDQENSIQLNTSFIKSDPEILKSRITVKREKNQLKNRMISLIIYVAAENYPNDYFSEIDSKKFSIKFKSKSLVNYQLNLKILNGELKFQQNINVSQVSLNKLTEIVQNHLKLSRNVDGLYYHGLESTENYSIKPNFVAFQLAFNGSFSVEMELLFNRKNQEAPLKKFDYQQNLLERMKKFDETFFQKFQFSNRFRTKRNIDFARSVLSNVLGSVSYFYGTSLVYSHRTPVAKSFGPVQLLTVVPSRSVFCRGFLWDDGFHQLLVSLWDPKLSITIVKSWFDLMNDEGWIQREVILGDEARSSVSPFFWPQFNRNANPPAFFLTIESLIEQKSFQQKDLQILYPRLKRWFDWYNLSQIGIVPTTFRWRGRQATEYELNPSTLTSGLDDYPRATHPTDNETHVDLRCWMALASRSMAKISNFLKLNDTSFQNYYHVLSDNRLLEKLHWSNQYQMFADYGLNSENVRMINVTENGQKIEKRQVLTPPQYEFVPNFGYISLFPFMLHILEPENPRLLKVMEDIQNPDLLWTPFGLRSIAKNSFYYRKSNNLGQKPYWRGPIWINLNYLTLKALNHYRSISGPYQKLASELYEKLSGNIVDNIGRHFFQTGFLWEQYDDMDGKPSGAHPFTGWSSLVVLMMTKKFGQNSSS